VILGYTLFSFSHCTEARYDWGLTEFWEIIYCIRSLNDIKKNMPDNCLEYQELPSLL